ncbi:fatty acid desaturase [Yeosuana sp. MJ-SS3]|uniref:Fatty acid desaturase n=1 Tax=Gilvirhabdus luticola TaxID=3079858 RepID=A0ABU3U495_9FLAO|nr:fatty acid desaturase [Yeosuana sp. MJ-SS3]MDU8885223.1 fatty acid desaturase [Yeosuana sp. MJ-SS3]
MNTSIYFKKNVDDNLHYRKLKSMLKDVITDLPEQRKQEKICFVLALPILFLIIYLLAIYFRDFVFLYYTLYSFLGIISVLIFINIIHDAVHNNIFKSRRYNHLIILIFDLIGGNSYIWKKRHMLMHHNFQNISGWDSDIEQAGLIKIYPHVKTSAINKFQHIFIFAFYPLFLFNWILFRDFKDFFLTDRLIKKVVKIPLIEYFKLFFFKITFFFYILVIPILLGVKPLTAIGALCIMLTVGSVFALLSLLTPHANETNQFPIPSENGEVDTSWLNHQFITTNDISLNNWFTKHFMGNFNFHLAHHLFPKISSVYAPEVTEVIKQYASKNNLNYRSYGLFEALKYHYRLIKANALDFNVFEEDM